MIDVPVLIVGGGPVGLTASIFLSHFGIASLLIEKHPGTAILPKARALNPRTMEMYRQIGLEDAIRKVAMPARFGGAVIWAESLAGAEIKRLETGRGSMQNRHFSVTGACGCSQDILEPALRERAESAGQGRLRFGTELIDMHVDDDCVRARIRNADGSLEQIRSAYLVAADGSQSGIRQQLGIARDGERDVYDSVNIHLRADLTPWIADRPAGLYLIEQSNLRGTFLTINGTDRWGFLVTSLSHYGYAPAQFTPEFCQRIVRQAVGVDELAIDVLGVSAWKASALVAQRYRSGPVFLAGDAAHEMPPTGGFGLNTGVQDVQNLAWKLAAVIQGHAGDALLDTYDAERRPVGTAVTQSSLLNALSMGRTARQTQAVLPRREFLNEIGLVFGARYRSDAVVAEDNEPIAGSDSDDVQTYLPSATPGCRAPHVWVTNAGERVSTLDLIGRQFVLMTAPDAEGWRAAARAVAPGRPGLSVVTIGDSDGAPAKDWLTAYGVDADGAVLVRPDGHVAWRGRHAMTNPVDKLSAVFDSLLARHSGEQAAQTAKAAPVSGLRSPTATRK